MNQRSTARHLAMAGLLGLGASGCATGLFQTAKTLPPGGVQVGLGVSHLLTDQQAAASEGASSSLEGFTMPEAGLRVGVGHQTDVGLGSYLGLGLRADAKHNLVSATKPYALAPRVGLGASGSRDDWLWTWLVGLIASYDLHRVISVYTGASLVTHYIHRKYLPEPPPGERLVGRTPWGDGLLQASVGVEYRVASWMALQAEAGHWFTLQNDPGDGYRFVPAHVLGARLVVGSQAP